MEKETGGAVLLYHSDDRYTPADDLAGFLEKEYGSEQYLTVSLPDGYELGSYATDMTYFSGWLLEGSAEDLPSGPDNCSWPLNACSGCTALSEGRTGRIQNPDRNLRLPHRTDLLFRDTSYKELRS